MRWSQTQTLEREVKFDAPVGLALPDLRKLFERTERLPQQHLRTAYFDTADGRLWNQGITLRHRITDSEGGGTWTLRFPHAADDSRLERTEMSWSGERAGVPPSVHDIVRGLVRREPLQQLVELDTTRLRLALHDEDDHAVAEIDDDIVVVTGGPRDGLRFRQVELELYAAESSISKQVTARLEEAGLAVENSPKLARAMGLPPSGSTRPRTGRQSSLADVVRAAVADGLDRLSEHDWRLRVALPEAAHDVHQARVAIRRLRSDLKTLRVVLDPIWVRHVRSDLKWVGSALGELRDADVLAVHLEDAPAQLRNELRRQRGVAAREVTTILASDRYLDLLDRLDAATRTPPFLVSDKNVRPEDTAREALPDLVGARWRALRRQVRKGGTDPSDEQLHRIRIEARHLRFAAERAEPVVGRRARHTASAAEKIQTILGEHHDAVAAEAWLREQVGRAATSSRVDAFSPLTWFEAGCFSAELRQRQHDLGRHWLRVWKALAKSKYRRWLR